MFSELVGFKEVNLQLILVRFHNTEFLLLFFTLNNETVENIDWDIEVENLIDDKN